MAARKMKKGAIKTAVKKAAAKVAKKPAAKKAARRAASNAPQPPARAVTPYLAVHDAAQAIEWYKKAFGAKELTRQGAPGGKIMHAALRIGDAEVYLADIFPGTDVRDPRETGPSVNLHVWSRNVDKMWANATANGAKVTMPIDDMFWGDRYGKVIDPFGHSWALAWKSKLPKAALEAKRLEAMKAFGAPPS